MRACPYFWRLEPPKPSRASSTNPTKFLKHELLKKLRYKLWNAEIHKIQLLASRKPSNFSLRASPYFSEISSPQNHLALYRHTPQNFWNMNYLKNCAMNFEMQKSTKFSFWLLENLQIFHCVHLLIFVKLRGKNAHLIIKIFCRKCKLILVALKKIRRCTQSKKIWWFSGKRKLNVLARYIKTRPGWKQKFSI